MKEGKGKEKGERQKKKWPMRGTFRHASMLVRSGGRILALQCSRHCQRHPTPNAQGTKDGQIGLRLLGGVQKGGTGLSRTRRGAWET